VLVPLIIYYTQKKRIGGEYLQRQMTAFFELTPPEEICASSKLKTGNPTRGGREKGRSESQRNFVFLNGLLGKRVDSSRPELKAQKETFNEHSGTSIY
jgi:hypothetical protein